MIEHEITIVHAQAALPKTAMYFACHGVNHPFEFFPAHLAHVFYLPSLAVQAMVHTSGPWIINSVLKNPQTTPLFPLIFATA